MGASGPSATLAVTPHSVPAAGAARQLHVHARTAFGFHTTAERMCACLAWERREAFLLLYMHKQCRPGDESKSRLLD